MRQPSRSDYADDLSFWTAYRKWQSWESYENLKRSNRRPAAMTTTTPVKPTVMTIPASPAPIAPTAEQLQTYREALRAHDWSFEYSDDHSVWQRGRTSLAGLQAMQRTLDPDWLIWDECAPKAYRHSSK